VNRVLIVVAVVIVAAAGCVGLITLLASRDSSQVGGTSGPGTLEPDRGSGLAAANAPDTPASPPANPPTSGRHKQAPVERDRESLSDDELLTALQQGNVVLAYDGNPKPAAALVAIQADVAGPFDPSLAAAGQAVILDYRPGVGGVIALAWRRKLVASGPQDTRLRAFAEAWLGQGPATATG
jgi:hypothetical protein